MSYKDHKLQEKTPIFKAIVWLAIIISLTFAYIYGRIRKDTHVLTQLQSIFPEEVEFQTRSNNPLLLEVHDQETKKLLGYCAVEKSQGWGGPLFISTFVNTEGILKKTIVLDHKETPSFFLKLQRHNFFEQFSGKSVTNAFVLGQDIDTVTHATITSKAVTDAVRKSSHALGRKLLSLQINERQAGWHFGINELILLLLYAGVLINLKRKSKILHYVIMTAVFIFLGFYLNSAIAIGNISQIMLGFIPSLKENSFWWILIGGALFAPLVLKKNLYCSHLCPFGVLQEFSAKLSGVNIALKGKNIKLAKTVAYFLTWLALLIIFITSNPAFGTYEPFAVFFRLEGSGIQWIILPVVVLSSFILTRFFCRFFCPVGVVLNILVKTRHNLEKILKRQQ